VVTFAPRGLLGVADRLLRRKEGRMSTGPALEARGLTKRFGGLAAVNDVSLDLWRAASTPSSAPTAPASRR
jgi:ABC-type sugar transport system ATPase subunit